MIVYAKPPKRTNKPRPPLPVITQGIVTPRKALPRELIDPETQASVEAFVERMMRPQGE
jgi:hypothetical protein